MDFKDVLSLIDVFSRLPIADILKIFERNKKTLEPILETVPKEVPKELPEPADPDVPRNAPVDQVYFSLDARGFWCQKKDGQLYSNEEFKKIIAGGGAQMVGDRFCIDITPKDQFGREIGTGDPRHIKIPGDVPVRYLWWRDKKLNTNGDPRGRKQEEEDHFHLQSVRDRDNGFTPVLQLETPEPGGHVVEFQAYILAEHNGGKDVYSNVISWNCD